MLTYTFGITGERRLTMLGFSDYAIIASIVLVFGGAGAAYASFRPADGARLARLERKIDAVLRHLKAVPGRSVATLLVKPLEAVAFALK